MSGRVKPPASSTRKGGPKIKPPRLMLHKKKNYWFILYNGVATSCQTADHWEASQKLAEFITGKTDCSRIHLAPILSEALAGAGEDAALYRRLFAFWGSKRIGDINEHSCRAYLAFSRRERGEPVLPAGADYVVDGTGRCELKMLFARAREQTEVADADFEVVGWMPREGSPRERFLFADEVYRFVHVALGRIRCPDAKDGWMRDEHGRFVYRDAKTRRRWEPIARLIMLGAWTGTRLSLMKDARWEASPGHGHLDLDRALFYRSDSEVEGALKAAPIVKVFAKLRRFLYKCRARDLAMDCQRVIHGQRGGGVLIDPIWEEVREAAGLSDDVVRHTLRHTCATLLLAGGLSELVVANFLGITVDNLLKHYAQAHPRLTAGVGAALSDFARGVPAKDSLETRRAKPL